MDIFHKENIKYSFIYGLTCLVVIVVFVGCKSNNPLSGIISSEKKENIVILVDPLIEKDVSDRLKELANENLVDWEIKTESQDKDIVITTDKNNIPTDWKIDEIFNQKLELKPGGFDSSFSGQFGEGFVLYFGSNTDKSDIIKKTLQGSFNSSSPKTSEIEFLGDVMLSRTVENKSRKAGDWNWPFQNIKSDITPTDLTIANLESPFSDPPKPFAHNTVFGADTNMVQGLIYGAVDIVCLANNHFGDSGIKGMNLTFQILKDNGISYFGAGDNNTSSHEALIKEVNGIKFAFLGYVTSSVTPNSYASTPDKSGLNLMNNETLKKDIEEAKKKADYIVVSMHAGTEYTPNPNGEQTEFAHNAIDAGADMVYGHHPHVVEAIEVYKNKPIYYSLGNFVFDQEWSQETKEGIVVKIKFIYDKIVSMELMPILIENYGQPQTANGTTGNIIINRIFEASNKLK